MGSYDADIVRNIKAHNTKINKTPNNTMIASEIMNMHTSRSLLALFTDQIRPPIKTQKRRNKQS